ncbi:kinase-like domain-containing protein [Mycena galericulata]|nr:kinase-like domain-containing protein [Mycena galericulata]
MLRKRARSSLSESSNQVVTLGGVNSAYVNARCMMRLKLASFQVAEVHVDRILAEIASGSSGVVVKAVDSLSGGLVAVKITRASRRGLGEADRAEAVSRLVFARRDWHTRLFARLLDRGVLDGDDCLIYPLGGLSLHDLLVARSSAPLPLCHVQKIAWQIAHALQYLHSLGLIHTDIKPANIILATGLTRVVMRADSTGRVVSKEVLRCLHVKIIDLDHAVEVGPPRRWLVGTDKYRAPEVWAGCVWSKPIDLFSLGCVIFELCVGFSLFGEVDSAAEMLVCMERVIGLGNTGYGHLPDDTMLSFDEGPTRLILFDATTYGQDTIGRVRSRVPLSTLLPPLEAQRICYALLCLDAERRLTPEMALRHSYLTKHVAELL